MSNEKITTGEWYIEEKKEKNKFGAFATNISSTGSSIHFISIWGSGEDDEEAEANAKLVCSSPKMKETLSDCAETMNILLIELKKDDVILRHEVQSRLSQIEKTLKQAGFSL